MKPQPSHENVWKYKYFYLDLTLTERRKDSSRLRQSLALYPVKWLSTRLGGIKTDVLYPSKLSICVYCSGIGCGYNATKIQIQNIIMRAFSREAQTTYYKFQQSLPRNFTQ